MAVYKNETQKSVSIRLADTEMEGAHVKRTKPPIWVHFKPLQEKKIKYLSEALEKDFAEKAKKLGVVKLGEIVDEPEMPVEAQESAVGDTKVETKRRGRKKK